jgi:hypothetical protein
MKRRRAGLGAAVAIMLLTAACGSSSTSSGGQSSGGSSSSSGTGSPTSSGSARNPRDPSGSYACGLLTSAQIAAAAGGPSKPPQSQPPTVGPSDVANSCTIDSQAACPQNLPQSNPYCPSAYHIELDTDTWNTAAAAMAAYTMSAGGRANATTVSDVGADAAFLDPSGSVGVAVKGTTLVTVAFQPPGGLSGNPAVPATFPPSALPALHMLVQDAVSGLSS